MTAHDDHNGETVLDHNVEQLLRSADEPPRIESQARARIRDAVIAAGVARAPARPVRRRAIAIGAGVAAAAAAAVLLAVWSGVTGADSYANSHPAPRTVELADGSYMILNTGAEVDVIGPRRVKIVRGDAIFDIVPGKGRFVVEARHGDIEVLGTRFFVRALADETQTAVIRGKVAIENRDGAEELGAGEQGVLRDGARPTRRPAPRLSHLTSWARQAPGFETTSAAPIRRGNLFARFPNWPEREFPLPMRALTVDVHVENQVARVAIDQTFFNHRVETLEGVYSFALPSDAAISRLAMYVNGHLMEAGIVERQRARAIYDQIVYQRRDPALLEWMAGNLFKVRIFPLDGRTEKRILLSYTQALSRLYGDYSIRVPIPEIDDPVGRVSFKVRIVGCGDCEVWSTSHEVELSADGDDRIVTYSAADQRIGDDLLLTVRDHRIEPKVATEGQAMIARVRPELTGGQTTRRPRRWVILDDTSASRTRRDLGVQAHIVGRLMHELDETDQVSVIAFDATRRSWRDPFVDVAKVPEADLTAWINTQSSDGVGVTDLGAALELARQRLASARADGYDPYVILLGDGIATGGERDPAALAEPMRGQATVVAIAVGELEDASVLDALARATGGMTAAIDAGDDVDWRVYDLVASLNTPRVVGLEVALEDATGAPVPATSIYPSARQLADGDELTVIAGFDRPAVSSLPSHVRLSGTVDGKPWSQRIALPPADPAERAGYLPRLWAQRRIEALLAEPGDDHEAGVLALGMKHWLVTPYSSLLVLESEAMYREFKVARSSDAGWAGYRVPRKIPVVSEPAPRNGLWLGVPVGDQVVRVPVPVFVDSGRTLYGYGYGTSYGTIGLGRSGGAGVGGGGLGFGFGGDIVRDPSSSFSPPSLLEPVAGTEAAKMPVVPEPIETVNLTPREDWMMEGDRRSVRRMTERSEGRPLARRGYRYGWHTDPWADSPGAGLPIPVSLHYATDPRLADLASFVPALFTTRFDREREALLALAARSSFSPGKVDDEAARLIDAARRAVVMRRYTDRDGRILHIDGRGGIAAEQVQMGRLREQIAYDGERLVHTYPELGLAVRRQVGDAEAALLSELAPFLIPRAETLARWYHVTAAGSTITLRSVGDDRPVIELALDANGQLAQIRRIDGAQSRIDAAFEWADGSVTIIRGNERSVVSFERDFSFAVGDTGDAVVIDLPLLRPELPATDGDTGSATWLHRRHQLLAAHGALGNIAAASQVAGELARWRGQLTDGELALAASSLVASTDVDLIHRALRGTSPVARYLRALRGGATAPAELDRLATGEDSLISTLAAYRTLLFRLAALTRTPAVGARAIEQFARRNEPALTFIAATQFSAAWSYRAPDAVARAWDSLQGSGSWRVYAAYQAARAMLAGQRHAAAAERFERVFDEAIDAGTMLPVDWLVQQAFAGSGQGDAGWRQFWARLRNRALDHGTPELLLSLSMAAQTFGLPADADRLIARLAESPIGDLQRRLEVVDGLVAVSRFAEASAVLGPTPDGDDVPPALLDRAVTIAEHQGRLADAAKALTRLIAARTDGPVPLSQLRADQTRLIDLWSRVARATAGTDRTEAVDAALAEVARWRALDPDNPAIDQQSALLLFSIGRTTEALRYLSTAIERHPGEGSAYQTVATALEQEGMTAEAEPVWARAFEVEPTNPTWLLRRSQALRSLHRDIEASAMLAQIAAGSWHERFADVIVEANRLRQAERK